MERKLTPLEVLWEEIFYGKKMFGADFLAKRNVKLRRLKPPWPWMRRGEKSRKG
jgi:hypothetical protein